MRHPLHDYSSAAGYFITFSTFERKPLLGSIEQGVFVHSPAGLVVEEAWRNLPQAFPGLVLDIIQLMPDHVHCILILCDPKLTGGAGPLPALPKVMQSFKGTSAREINLHRTAPGQGGGRSVITNE